MNVDRDWEKLGLYARQLTITDETINTRTCYSNDYLPEHPHATFPPLDGAYISELKAS
ncbi:hypothetical protein [Candidatus Sororendozoicomonas aggregata]|uniref:hypothetical protein n=1 Tax=Candidatus Sororendozoicomonas aggregata TaxID=3073239 RepID=UPI002ED3F566